jgi:hypothetical protein
MKKIKIEEDNIKAEIKEKKNRNNNLIIIVINTKTTPKITSKMALNKSKNLNANTKKMNE